MLRKLTARLGIGAKLALSILVIVSIAMVFMNTALDRLVSDSIEERSNAEVQEKIKLLISLLNVADAELQRKSPNADFDENLKQVVKSMKIGRTGYFYAIDANPGSNYGVAVIHPAAEGKNLLPAKDADGREFVKLILENKNGTIRYPWINKELGETSSRDKVVAYALLKSRNWVIGGGTYLDEYQEEIKSLKLISHLIAAAMVVVISALLYWMIRTIVVQPLKNVNDAAKTVAQGDFTGVLEINRTDEIGELQSSVNQISSNLALTVEKVHHGAAAVSTASAEIAQGNIDLSNRTESLATILESTSAAMEELGSTVKQNAENAHDANMLASDARAIAMTGGEVMTQVVDTMKSINEHSGKIADIIGVIDSISFQTNILALNAAVEAARAGEQGRGFAVVASEVRNLAGRSAQAAKEIRTLISDSLQQVEQGGRYVDEAGATMDKLVTSIRRVTDLMSDISTASNEQNIAVERVGQSVSQMDQSTQQNAALVEEIAAAATSLKAQSEELVQAIGVFKIR